MLPDSFLTDLPSLRIEEDTNSGEETKDCVNEETVEGFGKLGIVRGSVFPSIRLIVSKIEGKKEEGRDLLLMKMRN